MYLALQHGVFVANYPLVDEDLESHRPAPAGSRARGPLLRADHHPGAAEPRSGSERRPNSRYASLEQCSFELREAEALYRAHGVPVVNSATRSVEEMSTVILQQLTPRRPS